MNKAKTISIIIPCYNELPTIQQLLQKVDRVSFGSMKKEIIVIDDGSDDGSWALLRGMIHPKLKLLRNNNNQGKGVAVKKGILASSGNIVVIQDADLEYDPRDLVRMARLIEKGDADIVFGSRLNPGTSNAMISFNQKVANKLLTHFSNFFTGLKLTDMETCYKMLDGDIARSLASKLKARRFGFEPELTVRIARAGYAVREVGIKYHGRSKKEGKKINVFDGIKAFWEILYFSITVR